MNQKQAVSAVLGAMLAIFASSASAVQFGVAYSHNDGDAKANDGGAKFDLTGDQFGLQLDTGAIGRVFQYRLGIDYIKGSLENADYHGVAYTNHFGFKLNAGDATSFWIGPTIHVADLNFDDNDAWLLAFGPTAGVNIALDGKGQQLLALELGYRDGTLYVDDDNGSGFFFSGSDYDVRDFQFKAGLLFGRH
jgi:hypothetical protein